ncbi:MFS transporter [Actinomadura darangshiensis]|uniref:MFS transporter n=1 Tax=Actinomadura darangshiensis TaxID=705336 RepID=A0A4R5BU81_9ACTN|nr:MFS transporter [Actinomadura darangshiensis]TDD89629.1 MFS transporter [Actinomadura darangshiensis]
MSAPAVPSAARWWTLVIVSVAAFMLILDLSIVAVALPSIRTSLHADLSELQWVFDAYALTLAAFLVIAGSVADAGGRKRTFITGLAGFWAASIACGLAQDIVALDAARAAQGVGAAVMFAVGPALLGHEFHGKERATAFAAFGAATGVAAAGGPLIGGALTSGSGWRWIFLMNVPIGLVLIPLALRTLRESRLANPAPPDVAGMVAFTVSLAAIVLAIIRGNADGWFSAGNTALYALSAVGLAVFLGMARARGGRAMFDLRMLGDRTFLGLSLATLLVNACGMPFIFIATTYLQSVLNGSAWQAGLRFLPMTIAMFCCGALAGALPRKVPFRALLAVAVAAVGAGALLTSLSDAGSGWTSLIPALVVTGVGIGLFMPTRAALSIGVFEPERAGVASGINETFQQVGIALGLAVAGAFFENRVIAAFRDSAAGARLGPGATEAGSAISAGNIDAVAGSAPPGTAADLVADGRAAFTDAFHQTMALCAVLAFLAAVIALVSVSNKALHESALTGVPPELPDQVPPPASEKVG